MKAIALLSGGLDSTLAVKVMLDQGIEVEAFNFFMPFCSSNAKDSCAGGPVRRAAEQTGVKLNVVDITDDFIQMLKNPKYGYGKNLNPCIDCKILMNKKAKEYLSKVGASFVITGEVLGQRPMSQHRWALQTIEKESGLAGLILRPLSAQLLPPTIPEEKGWVDREKLLRISGRARKAQMTLAADFQINEYPSPAGGCLLTDPGFSKRLKDLMDNSCVTLDNIELLKLGRHFRISNKAKVVVGRDEAENKRLNNLLKPGDVYFTPMQTTGPEALARGEVSAADLEQASRIIARYCDNNSSGVKIINYVWPDGEKNFILAKPAEDEQLEKVRI